MCTHTHTGRRACVGRTDGVARGRNDARRGAGAAVAFSTPPPPLVSVRPGTAPHAGGTCTQQLPRPWCASDRFGASAVRPRRAAGASAPRLQRRVRCVAGGADTDSGTDRRRQRAARDELPASRQDLYDVLRLPRSATLDQVKAAYRERSKQLHPDVVARGTATKDAGGKSSDENDSEAAETMRRQEHFDGLLAAYRILSDPELRRVYDASGLDGVEAVASIEERYASTADLLAGARGRQEVASNAAGGSGSASAVAAGDRADADDDGMSSEELEYLGLAGDFTALLEASAPATATAAAAAGSGDDDGDGRPATPTDACPRSVDEAVANLFHADAGFRYYAAWWLSRFRVTSAEDALVRVLRESEDRTALGGYSLRRRAAVALGNIGSVRAVGALSTALDCHEDWHLRSRAAEALAKIAMLNAQASTPAVPDATLLQLVAMLERGVRSNGSDDSGSGAGAGPAASAAAQFDLSHLDEEKRATLEAIFAKRRADEARARRTTHTPNLGIDMESSLPEPYEWIIKVLGFSADRFGGARGGADDADERARARVDTARGAGSGSGKGDNAATDTTAATADHASLRHQRQRCIDAIAHYVEHEVPLVKYAAHKALYQLTGDETHAEALVGALAFGAEHHYSQRVLIRDLGDTGYLAGARAIAHCGMVENSFKIFALKHVLRENEFAVADARVAQVLTLIDELL